MIYRYLQLITYISALHTIAVICKIIADICKRIADKVSGRYIIFNYLQISANVD